MSSVLENEAQAFNHETGIVKERMGGVVIGDRKYRQRLTFVLVRSYYR